MSLIHGNRELQILVVAEKNNLKKELENCIANNERENIELLLKVQNGKVIAYQ